ncbi:hypothetical protein [Flavobacterium sp. HNIBRBA15423]|uniref:hypothetical protein n=1 Tax=Flavobacterium sp. HNIBRBA15423 TaxID=3458683 RepID=UPI004044C418
MINITKMFLEINTYDIRKIDIVIKENTEKGYTLTDHESNEIHQENGNSYFKVFLTFRMPDTFKKD